MNKTFDSLFYTFDNTLRRKITNVYREHFELCSFQKECFQNNSFKRSCSATKLLLCWFCCVYH